LSTAPYSTRAPGHSGIQLVLAVHRTCLYGQRVPALLRPQRAPLMGAAGLLFVALAQTLSLPAELVGTQQNWIQAGIGWCLLPLLVRRPLPRAAAGPHRLLVRAGADRAAAPSGARGPWSTSGWATPAS
jgi:hypothetical protein